MRLCLGCDALALRLVWLLFLYNCTIPSHFAN